MNNELYMDFDKLVSELIEENEQELSTSEGLLVGRNGEKLLSVNSGKFPQTCAVSTIARQEAKNALRDSLQPTEINVYFGDDANFSVVFAAGDVIIDTQMALQDLQYALSVAAAKYSVTLLEQLNVEVNESNCQKVANYFDFNIFKEGMLEYELEQHRDK